MAGNANPKDKEATPEGPKSVEKELNASTETQRYLLGPANCQWTAGRKGSLTQQVTGNARRLGRRQGPCLGRDGVSQKADNLQRRRGVTA